MASPIIGAIDICLILLVILTASVAFIESVVTRELKGELLMLVTAEPDKTPCVTYESTLKAPTSINA